MSSAQRVGANRSAKQFARGQRGGIRTTSDAHIGQDSIERRRELTGPVADQEPELSDAIAKLHHEVADLLGSPPAVRIRRRAQHVHVAVADLQDEKHVDPL